MTKLTAAALATIAAILAIAVGATTAPAQTTSLTIYSGREQALVKPIMDRFTKDTGIQLNVRYASSRRSRQRWSRRAGTALPTSTGRRSPALSASSAHGDCCTPAAGDGRQGAVAVRHAEPPLGRARVGAPGSSSTTRTRCR